MPRPVSYRTSPELIASWLDRYRGLRTLIAERSDDPLRWVWEIRAKALAYLLKRYGSDTTVRHLLDVAVVKRHEHNEIHSYRPPRFHGSRLHGAHSVAKP